jgi:ABC-2 type transport system permease protein
MSRVLVRHAFGRVWKGAAVWGVVFGSTAATSALSYVQSYPTAASRQQIAATTGQDVGLAILFGPISDIDTVGGYTAYKSFVFLTTIGALWALLAGTRLLRGDEDDGRWQLLLSGATSARRATAATLAGLVAAVSVILLGTVLLVVLAARNPDLGFGTADAVAFGLSVALVPVVFSALGALVSQLGRSRRTATQLGLLLFGLAFVVRMVADADPSTRWLLWATPFGWSERVRPFTDNDLLPLVPALITAALLGAVAVLLAGRRDVGSGVLASRDVAEVRPFGLGSSLGLLARLQLPGIVAWWVGTVAAAFVFGIIAKVVAGSLPDSVRDTLGRFGVRGALVEQFLGVGFLFLATMVALVPVSVVGAAAQDESSGRLVHLLVRPLSRRRVLLERLAVGAVAVVAAGLLAGLAVWAGAASQHLEVGLGTALGAGMNVVPTALVVLALGAVVLAVRPRAAVPVVYGVVIGSLLLDTIASLASSLEALTRVSLFHYMALAPAVDPSPGTHLLTLGAAALLALIALALWERRDLQGG